MKYETELDAVRAWVDEFDHIPTALVVRAFKESPEELELLAGGQAESPCCGEDLVESRPDGARCAVCDVRGIPESSNYCEDCAEGAADDEPPDFWCSHCGRAVNDLDVVWAPPYDWPAIWGTMFSPEACDRDWIRDNLQTVAACGFVVYDSDETDILLAIDGAGYDFFSSHWVPLYRARGLQWHKSAAE